MRRLELGARDRRAIVGGLGAVTLVVLAARGIPAYRAWSQEMSAESAEARAALVRARTVAGRANASRDSAAARGRRMVALAPAILSGESVNGAGAALAGILSGAAAQSGVKLGAIQVRNDSMSRGTFTRIGVHAEATGDVRGLTHMLASLEAGPTLLVIRSFAVTQPDPAAGDDRIEALKLELDLEGLMLNPRAVR